MTARKIAIVDIAFGGVADLERAADGGFGFFETGDIVTNARFAKDKQRRAVLARQFDRRNAVDVKLIFRELRENFRSPKLESYQNFCRR